MAPEQPSDFIYQRIADAMEARIRSGEYAPGTRLPTDAAQAREHGVNQLTVRKAMLILQEKGLVERRQGRGTTVIEPDERPLSILYVGPIIEHVYQDLFGELQTAAQRSGGQVTGFAPISHDTRPEERLERSGQLWAEIQPQLKTADAVIAVSDRTGEIHGELVSCGTRAILVSIFSGEERRDLPGVHLCPATGTEVALQAMISQGHR
ncbi:MAG: GntR family transcriptional regulator, partial [Planctomycetota bacterium]